MANSQQSWDILYTDSFARAVWTDLYTDGIPRAVWAILYTDSFPRAVGCLSIFFHCPSFWPAVYKIGPNRTSKAVRIQNVPTLLTVGHRDVVVELTLEIW